MTRVPKLFAIVALLGGGCVTDVTAPGGGDDTTNGDDNVTPPGDDDPDPTDPDPVDDWQALLDARAYDYGAALRTAALRLVGQLPSKTEIDAVTAGGKAAYDAQIAAYLADARFGKQILAFWRDTFKMGGTAELDTAPAFAAQLTVEGRSYLELLTATTGNCPTVNATTGVFTAANCASGAPAQAGLLTNPGVMKQFASNLAFRRTRWVQEIFDCTAFPAEIQAPVDIDGAKYTAPWAFDSISGVSNGGRIDFLDTAGVVCANCHATMNHIAPLFANFDDAGQYQTAISVLTPLDGNPVAQRTDYLPAGQGLAWRKDQPVTDLTSLGSTMAADRAIAQCAVARAWNWALGRGDIVATLSTVPSDVIQQQTTDFVAGGHKFKDLLLEVFTSDDFTLY